MRHSGFDPGADAEAVKRREGRRRIEGDDARARERARELRETIAVPQATLEAR